MHLDRGWLDRRGWLLAALPAVMLAVVILHYYWDFASDDAFISFRYADHLARGLGLEWNPGYRVEGYSNFLFVVGMALLQVLGFAAPVGARLLSWLATFALLLGVTWVVRRGARERPALELLMLAPLPVVLAFPLQYWTALRLETALFACLLLWAPARFVVEQEQGRGRWGSALLYLALAMTRPEGALFALVPGAMLLRRARHGLRDVLRERWLWLAILGGGFAAYTLWRLLYFGHLLPNTYYAKVSGESVLEHGWGYLVRFLGERPMTLIFLAAALLSGGLSRQLGRTLAATLLLQAAAVVVEGGDWMREYRLLVPTIPLAAAVLGLGLQGLASDASVARRVALFTGMALLALNVQQTMGTPWREWSSALDWQRRDLLINLEGQMVKVSRDVGLYLRHNSRPTDLVAVNHAGAVPYFSRLPSLDMAGLNDLHIARVPGPRHGKWDADYVLAQKPRYVVLNTHVRPLRGNYVPGYWKGETALFEHIDFQRYYRALRPVWMWSHRPLSLRGFPPTSENYIMLFERDPSRYRRTGPCLDFESGSFAGWAVTGTAFGAAPATGSRGYQDVEGYEGQYLANSFPGSDADRGLLRSAPFEVRGQYMELLVGGAADQQRAGVRLLHRGRRVRVATGRNDYRLRRVVWELRDLKGRSVVLEIYDNATGPWGHVMADSLCQFDGSYGHRDNKASQIIEPGT